MPQPCPEHVPQGKGSVVLKESTAELIASMGKWEAGRWDLLFWVMGASCLQLKPGGFISEPGHVRH